MSIVTNTSKEEIEGYDVCIIGSGPAGMTLCNELVSSGKKVCVLESGTDKKRESSDSLRATESTGEIKIKESSRERVFGGTSTTWGGGSAPMDEVDFSFREFLGNPSGWPFGLEEMIPYYKRTVDYGFPDYDLFDNKKINKIRETSPVNFLKIDLDDKLFIAMDPPWNFAKKLINVFDNKNIDLYLDSTVTSLDSVVYDGEESVSVVNIVSSKGFKWKMKAKIFVIAAGGLESTRLLLLSKNSVGIELGNEHDQVGRYVMNHPKNSYGVIRLNKPVYSLPYYFGYYFNGFAGFAGYRLDSTYQIKNKILNSYIRFEPIFPWSDNVGVWSFLTIIKKMNSFINYWKKKQKHVVHLRDYNETPDSDGVGKFSWRIALIEIINNIGSVSYYCIHRLFPRISLPVYSIRLRNFMEMEPRAENRITLGSEKDLNDSPIPRVDLNTSTLDKKSLIVLHAEFRKELERLKIGKLESNLENEISWPVNLDASHHIGGTIIGINPEKSVVDIDLKVHSLHNLYICSSSVFPTSGCANPTYTICALSIRLADKLKQ